MAQPTEFAITGVGMRCAVGLGVAQSCASIRAGISRFAEWASFGGDGESAIEIVGAAVVPALGDRDWVEKFEDLASAPFLEAMWMAELHGLADPGDQTRWGVYVSTPALDRPDVSEENAGAFLEDLRDKVLLPLEPTSLDIVTDGHTGFLMALSRAMTDLIEGRQDLCVVGGMDSLLSSACLEWLFSERKLKTAGTPAGLIPGEAAAFVVLETVEGAIKRGVPIIARVAPVRTAEQAPSDNGSPDRGETTARALKAALADARCNPLQIGRVINDLNGERWRFLDWAFAANPALSPLPPDWQLWHPADSIGDIGAATGAAHLCVAARAFQRSYAAGDAILVCNVSDTGRRAAVVAFAAKGG